MEQDIDLEVESTKKGDELFLPIRIIAEGLDYSFNWDTKESRAVLLNKNPNQPVRPYSYDLRKVGRAPEAKDQGLLGTCWSFASLTALESSLLPEIKEIFSVDHMSINNGFSGTQNDGGEYTMAIAYLASWRGPVYEKDDPYGDGYSPEDLTAVRHLQEAQVIEGKNFDKIKDAVYRLSLIHI